MAKVKLSLYELSQDIGTIAYLQQLSSEVAGQLLHASWHQSRKRESGPKRWRAVVIPSAELSSTRTLSPAMRN